MFFTKDGNPVRVGVPGLADAGCIVAVTVTPDMVGKTIGVAVQAEFKAGGQQSEAQCNWQRAVESRGGVYAIVKSPEDMVRLVDRVKSGEAWK